MDHTLTTEAARKIARLINKAKYQPDAANKRSRRNIPEADQSATGEDWPDIKLIFTPSGGIGAAAIVTENGDGPTEIQYNSAWCYEIRGRVQLGSNTVIGDKEGAILVYNPTWDAIPGHILIPCFNRKSQFPATEENFYWAVWTAGMGSTVWTP